MIFNGRNCDTDKIRQRANKVRAGWSPLDRLQRRGLPPDIPDSLQRRLVACVAAQWQNGVGGRSAALRPVLARAQAASARYCSLTITRFERTRQADRDRQEAIRAPCIR